MAIAGKATATVIAGLTVFAAACNTIGPTAISNGRIAYNQVIQETSKQQVFMNLVRVYKEEPTLFMDVTEVDAAMLMQVSANGAKSGLGAHAGTTGGTLAGSVGAVGGAAEYQESPTIRYQPLQGQPLVEQIATPITVETIGKLYDSEWHVGAVLSLAADRVTQDFLDSPPIIDAMNALDDYGVIGVAAAKTGKSDSKPPEPKDVTVNVQSSGQNGGGNKAGDTLAIYKRGQHPLLMAGETREHETTEIAALWQRVRQFYESESPANVKSDKARDTTLSDWVLIPAAPAVSLTVPEKSSQPRARGTSSQHAATGSSPAGATPAAAGGGGKRTPAEPEAPDLRTHSAIGIIKTAFLQPKAIEIVSRARYDRIVSWGPNAEVARPHQSCTNRDWYTLLPRIDGATPPELLEDPDDSPPKDSGGSEYSASRKVLDFINAWQSQPDYPSRCLYTMATMNFNFSDYDMLLAENRLFNLRRYILIIKEPTCPEDAYAAYSEGGECYYIDKDDRVSKTNFILISQFLTMQAVPPQSAPLTPTISVGGQGG
jgi:hypothetical protein